MTATTLRYVAGTRITGALPCHVVTETPSVAALFQPAGSVWQRATGIRGGPRGRNMLPGGWDGDHAAVEWIGDGVLRVHRFGEPWSVWRWVGADNRWSDDFYVNLEDPWRRTPVGFDSGDWILDVVARADGTWRYKDEDELEWAESTGVVDATWAARTREAARNAIAAVEAKTWPFSADWDEWMPDQTRDLPMLPDNWASVPEPGTGA